MSRFILDSEKVQEQHYNKERSIESLTAHGLHRVQVQVERLMHLRHASTCRKGKDECDISTHCWKLQVLWKHLLRCKKEKCTDICMSTRYLLYHYGQCSDAMCAVCVPVRDSARKVKTPQDERNLLNVPPKRLRVSLSQSNFEAKFLFSSCPDSPRESIGSEASTDDILTSHQVRIMKETDLTPLINRFEICEICNDRTASIQA